eukprot:CAMPEP_0202816422 /NCGR_PEP_ID=MMETSP1389-20130828/6953_1 /ASSEMBLY_ACC=CAM_ASM_000865 /TAXON_ID=302021 /ORGANISM="Rhodomonas sp., Strain CCMP768" /LENGTH=58 /DNA_ID=CAMNT_0049488487 /DNA_START=158 /DNA_END=334 /DNA_ORIENTATION=-
MASLLLIPHEHRILADHLSVEELSLDFQLVIRQLRETKAGQFALHCYQYHRHWPAPGS